MRTISRLHIHPAAPRINASDTLLAHDHQLRYGATKAMSRPDPSHPSRDVATCRLKSDWVVW
jgi:hypothetical protein